MYQILVRVVYDLNVIDTEKGLKVVLTLLEPSVVCTLSLGQNSKKEREEEDNDEHLR